MTKSRVFPGIILLVLVGFGPLKLLAAPLHSDALRGECPDGYKVKPGLNVDFPSDGKMRAFVLVPPSDFSKPVPVWVPLTGTVESTNANLNVARSGANALMADKGFMVIGAVRQCADQDPDRSGEVCNGPGIEGWNWRPWTEGRAAAAEGDKWKNDEGPDSSSHGHMWPQINTQEFNHWALTTMASHPKGTPASDFHLSRPPEGYSCRVGPFTDHY
jgi:hypothetical protein